MPGIALIEYFTTEEKTYLFIVRPEDDKPIVLESDISEEQLKECSKRLLGEGGKRARGVFRRDLELVLKWQKGLDFCHDVSEKLIHPFLKYVEGFDTLYLVPHGWLHYLPLHALKCRDGEHLIEKFKIVYSPSATVIKYCQAKNKAGRTDDEAYRAGSCLAFGVGKDDDDPEMLAFFHDEARYVAREGFGEKGEYRIGVEASKSHFIENHTHRDVIHMACHGWFDESLPLKSGLLLSNGASLPPENFEEASEDMLLTVEDIFNLELDADLVTLSACVTGVNENKPGDELIGLTRALIYAGAPSVIVSLWSVYSDSTLELMKSFYKYWMEPVKSMSKADAMQRAQLDMLQNSSMKKWKDPFHWAPFILVGDWK